MIIRFPTERTPQHLIPFVLGLAGTLSALIAIVLCAVAGVIKDESDLRSTLVILSIVSGGTGILTFGGLWLARKLRARR